MPRRQTQQDGSYQAMKTVDDLKDDLDVAIQMRFDDVDRIVQQGQKDLDMLGPLDILNAVDTLEGLLTLAKAIQTLRPSTDHDPNPKLETDASRPTSVQEIINGQVSLEDVEADFQAISSDPSQGSEKQSGPPKGSTLQYVTNQEWGLVAHMRSEGLSAGKLTTFLEAMGQVQCQPKLDQILREET
jgi:hypothetical protein